MGFDMKSQIAPLLARHGGKVLLVTLLALTLVVAAAGDVAAAADAAGHGGTVPACKVANNNSSVWTHNPHCGRAPA